MRQLRWGFFCGLLAWSPALWAATAVTSSVPEQQLQQAQMAAKEAQHRAQQLQLQNPARPDWEQQQQLKAQQQFAERVQREQRYLQQAKDAVHHAEAETAEPQMKILRRKTPTDTPVTPPVQ